MVLISLPDRLRGIGSISADVSGEPQSVLPLVHERDRDLLLMEWRPRFLMSSPLGGQRHIVLVRSQKKERGTTTRMSGICGCNETKGRSRTERKCERSDTRIGMEGDRGKYGGGGKVYM